MFPLEEVVVVDASQALSGPLATQTLGDMGADVIKIEHPGSGDLVRNLSPQYGDLSAYFVSTNRNKRSVTLNLKEEAGQKILHELIEEADIFLQNFAPGLAEQFNATDETLRDINEELIYCDISGYGDSSPYSEKKAFDILLQGETGMMGVTGTDNDEPIRVGVSICDISAAMTATYAVTTALYHRSNTGEGQYIDIGLMDSSFQLLLYHITNYFAAGQDSQRLGTKHPNLTPYQAFETSDSYIVVGVVSQPHWPRFCEAIDRLEWIEDETFGTFDSRLENRTELEEILKSEFARRTTKEWVELFEENEVPCREVNTVEEVVTDPHIEARGMIDEIEDSSGNTYKMPSNPVQFSTLETASDTAPPELGEHTDDILEEFGYDETQIRELRDENVI